MVPYISFSPSQKHYGLAGEFRLDFSSKTVKLDQRISFLGLELAARGARVGIFVWKWSVRFPDSSVSPS